jgi:mRNA interferase YafQ
MYAPVTTNKFDKELRRIAKRNKDLSKLQKVMKQLAAGEPLAPRHRDHVLIGNYAGRRECHIEPDWLLIYKLDEENAEIIFERTGSHSDLF